MIDNIEYLSAKTFYNTNVPDQSIQGTGTIIASQGKYYLATALHCMRVVDESGNEIVKPDWKNMSAVVYLQDSEVDLEIIGMLDADENEDWVLLKINKPNINFDYASRVKLTDTFNMTDTFGAYGFPHDIEDGIEMELTPANKRGYIWRVNDIIEGGSTKAITIEKGASGMGLFRTEGTDYMCLGLINKSVPHGAFNAMKLIRAKCFAPYFQDIYDGIVDTQKVIKTTAPEITQEVLNAKMKADYSNDSDLELCGQFQSLMEQYDYKEARNVIENLWKRHPEGEWASLNFLRCIALTTPEELSSYTTLGLNINYSTPESAIFGARSFSNYGFPKIGVEIWYRNALKFSTPEMDSLFYVECLGTDFGKVVHKEYDMVDDGKCVLYADKEDHRHCVIANTKTELGRILLGHNKSDQLEVEIVGEKRFIKIIAIFDKYYTVIHRALKDIHENGGNSILKPITLKEGATAEDIIKILESFGTGTGETEEQRMKRIYSETPSILMIANADDMVGSFYRLLFTDFPLQNKPQTLDEPKFYENINSESTFILDLSSLLYLFEYYMAGNNLPQKKFILSKFVFEMIKAYRRNFMKIMSFDIHKAMESGRIHRFSDDSITDMEMRMDALIDWCNNHCIMEASALVSSIHIPNEDDRTRMLKHSIALYMEKPYNRALITEDWYQQILLKEEIPLFTSKDFIDKIAFKTIF